MASYLHFLHFLLFLSSFSLLAFESQSQQPSPTPKKFVLQTRKDSQTNLHIATIQHKTPARQAPLLLDLNGLFLWTNCAAHLSRTYTSPICHSAQCARAGPYYCRACPTPSGPRCYDKCGVSTPNPITGQTTIAELAEDTFYIQSTQGSNPGPIARIPQFLFACSFPFPSQRGFPSNVQGVIGLGHGPISPPTQLASHFGFPPKFSMCLARSKSNGVIFFGDGPYVFLPGIDVSRPARYTPLIIGQKGEYYINVSSIKINNKLVPLDSTALAKHGLNGGIMISSTTPYTLLHHSIFGKILEAFTCELSAIPQVKPIPPFKLCFDSQKIPGGRVGPRLPVIDLVLQNQNVAWRIGDSSSMVEVEPGVKCLAFVDGGFRQRASIVLGSYQLEDNLLQFDLARSMLGFSSLLARRTSCANFNFTSNP
ncbi:hypothetical protein UlMin_029284 [Ulmus minor]